MSSKAIILLGGPTKGTRFRPLSLELPKPLFPVAGFPMVYHHIKACSLLPDLDEIILLGFFEPESFSEFITTTSQELNVNIRYLKENKVMGTAGGLYKFKAQILENSPEQIFVLHSDILCSFPLKEILEFHRKHGKEATMLVKKVDPQVAQRFGCVVKDPETNEILHYAEKPETYVSDLANCGVYLFSPSIFEQLDRIASTVVNNAAEEGAAGNFALSGSLLSSTSLPPLSINEIPFQLEQDILEPKTGNKLIYAYETKDFWVQIKQAGMTLLSNELLLKQYRRVSPDLLARSEKGGPQIIGDVIIHPSAQIHPTAKIGPNVCIGKNVIVEAGVRVKQALILDQSELRARSCIMYSIIGWGSSVGKWTRVEGTPDYDGKADFRSCGITIFGNGVSTCNEICIRNVIALPHKSLSGSVSDDVLL
eukprot:TRINITY_DN1061_c0_g1_i2.p1 TRINITY_DN1061_c0_g1~~TRINITY_DN1061_c0_g1_i2.p1  ORF type:complete len:423 (-),score=89.10 TRINITY_DN1061_c0_g1_i2:39-1307(-)